jgi:hypothetical protein
VLGIEPAEELPQLSVGVDVEIHLPGAEIIGEERVDRRRELDSRLERGTGERQPAALRRAGHPDPASIDFRHGHHEPGQLDAVEEDLPIQQPARAIEQATNDVALQRIAGHPTNVFRAPALAPTVECGDTEALRYVGQEREPLWAAAGVAVEHDNRWPGSLAERFRSKVFGIDARATHTREVEIEAVGECRGMVDRVKLNVCVNGVQLGKGC